MESKNTPSLKPSTKRFLTLLEKNLKQPHLDEAVRKVVRMAKKKELRDDLDKRKN